MNHRKRPVKESAETNTEVAPAVTQPEAVIADSSSEGTSTDMAPTGELMEATAKPNPRSVRGFLAKLMRRKLLVGLTAVALLLLVIAAVPTTRYMALSLFIKQSVHVAVVDSTTQLPVTSAQVTIAGVTGTTDEGGKATVRVPVGNRTINVTKQYYKDASRTVLVTLSAGKNNAKMVLVATGRQVPVPVINKITGGGLQGVMVSAQGTSVKTDKDGKAVIVLPTKDAKYPVKLTLDGYNSFEGTVTVTTSTVPENQFALTPTGRVFFLSNASGKIDVVSTSLDGTDRKVVLAGTGKEDRYNTQLLASSDWKYLALYSLRDGGANPKLFLIDASSGKLSVMDEGAASFSMVGWSGHYFVYQVNRNYEIWQPKRQAIKTYDATSAKLILIDETQGSGSSYYDYTNNYFSSIYLHGNALVYTTSWQGATWGGAGLAGKSTSVLSVLPDGSKKQTIKDFPIAAGVSYASLYARQYAPQAALITAQQSGGQNSTYYRYEGTSFTTLSNDAGQQMNQQTFPTYIVSPDGKNTLWSDLRDGKAAILIGDANGGNEKVVGSFGAQSAYGWYTNSYILTSKDSSELFIMSANGGQQLKVSDYYKPAQSNYGYGYGGR